MQILVLGMHRSGTSAVARLINMMGAYFGPEGVGIVGPDNPKGHWERRDVMELNNKILQTQDAAWHRPEAFACTQRTPLPPDLRAAMHRLILGMDAHRPFFIKDPRLCLTLPVWRPLLEMPVAVLVHRNPLEIALSLSKRDNMPIERGLALWERYATDMLAHTERMPRIFVHHGDLLAAPAKAAAALHKQLMHLGARRLALPSTPEIRAFIDPRLYRAKSMENTAFHAFTPQQKSLIAEIEAAK